MNLRLKFVAGLLNNKNLFKLIHKMQIVTSFVQVDCQIIFKWRTKNIYNILCYDALLQKKKQFFFFSFSEQTRISKPTGLTFVFFFFLVGNMSTIYQDAQMTALKTQMQKIAYSSVSNSIKDQIIKLYDSLNPANANHTQHQLDRIMQIYKNHWLQSGWNTCGKIVLAGCMMFIIFIVIKNIFVRKCHFQELIQKANVLLGIATVVTVYIGLVGLFVYSGVEF